MTKISRNFFETLRMTSRGVLSSTSTSNAEVNMPISMKFVELNCVTEFCSRREYLWFFPNDFIVARFFFSEFPIYRDSDRVT